MGLSLLAPLFLGGLGLLVAPFIIHQIRRPEREPLQFSSLLFIPNMPKEVIERRRIQHILLMLLRMLLLLLLVIAFSRPVWKAPLAIEAGDGPAYHVILLDNSYSMGAGSQFEDAQKAALKILGDVDSDDRVAVVTFAEGPRVVAPLVSTTDPDVGKKDKARLAIETSSVSNEATAYVPAMQFAHQMIMSATETLSELGPRTIHVVSEFRKNGMPERHTGWKLPPGISVNPVLLEADTAPNRTLVDVGLKEAKNGDLRVLAKVKNWAETDVTDLNVVLHINGVEVESKKVSIKGGNASQVSFRQTREDLDALEGYIALPDDGLNADNRFYFTWNPPRKKKVLVLTEEEPQTQWPSSWFFSQALFNEGNLPWETELVSIRDFSAALDDPTRRPTVVIAAGPRRFTSEFSSTLLGFVREGGQLLMTFNDTVDLDGLNENFLRELGLSSQKARRDVIHQRRFDLMSWVDLEHDIFVPFRGIHLNDFSMLRFYNHFPLEVSAEAEDVTILARLDNDNIAFVESSLGDGRAIVWPFSLNLEWTNLPKHPRFVPILHETLAYLTGLNEGSTAWRVGSTVSRDALVVDQEGVGVVQLPGVESVRPVELAKLSTEAPLRFNHPGLFRTKVESSDSWTQVDAVNLATSESDPRAITPAEFVLKISASPDLPTDPEESEEILGTEQDAAFVIEREYGRIGLLLLFAFIVVESWYMYWLKR